MPLLQRVSNYFFTHQYKNLHAVKYTLAFGLGFLAMLLLDDRYSVWILITIAVVMANQPVVGQMLQKSYFRILGTIVGVFFGVLTFSLPQSTKILFVVVMLTSLVITRLFSFRADETSQVAILGLVTFSLVTFLGHQSMHFALMRLLDTLIGIGISFVVSRFIFPLTSKRAFMFALQSSIVDLQQLIQLVFLDGFDRRTDPHVSELETQLVRGLSKMRMIVRSGRFESLRSPVEKNQMNQLVRYFRAIYHYLLIIDVALAEVDEKDSEKAKQFRALLGHHMHQLINCFETFLKDGVLTVPDFVDPFENTAAYHDYVPQRHTMEFGLRRIPYCLEKMRDVVANKSP